MTSIAKFLPGIYLDVPDCPSELAKSALINTIIDFCRNTDVWHYDHDNISLIANDNAYTLTPPSGTRIHRILNISNENGKPITEKNTGWLDYNVDKWRTTTGELVEYYATESIGNITVVPVPKAAVTDGLINIRLSLIPQRNAKSFDDFLYDDYLEIIEFGAKSKLLRLPNKQWSDMKSSNAYETLYREGRDDARGHVNRGVTGKVTRFGQKKMA